MAINELCIFFGSMVVWRGMLAACRPQPNGSGRDAFGGDRMVL
jgi:hypothetical protein